MRISKFATVLLCFLAHSMCVAPAWGDTIYRWVDADGRTHFSDVVPDAYKKAASKVESTSYNPTATDKAAADSRAAALKATASNIAVPGRTAPTPSTDVTTLPTQPASFAYEPANCKAWQRKFEKSKNCFDGMVGINSILTPRAMESCGEDVPNPYPVCGAPDSDDIEATGYFPLVYDSPRRPRRRIPDPPCVGCRRPLN